MIILLYPKNESTNREGKIMRIMDCFKPLKNHGMICEFIFLLFVNCFYFFYINKSNQDFWIYISSKINTISATDIIAFLTISIFAIGSVYFIGYTTASRINYHLLKNNLGFRDQMIKSGVLFFSAFFLPLLIVFLSKLELSNTFSLDLKNIALFFVINIVLVCIFGYLNERFYKNKKLCDIIGKGKIYTDDITPIEFSELYQTTDVDYRFKDSYGNEFIIPLGNVKKIEYSREKND